MAQVNSENSITVPVDTTRRHLLTVATAGAIAGLIPSAAMAAAPAVDPIFGLIEIHRKTHIAHVSSLELQARFERRYGIGEGG